MILIPREQEEVGLTDRQLVRRDVVDDTIAETLDRLIEELNLKHMPVDFEWNSERIGRVRDVVQEILVETGACTEQEFYPFIER